LQSKYASVLGNQQVSFKRVDLGDRGTFYRAMVGPFSGRDQAYEMCQNLKAAGGECVVQRN
jgi:cell division protein FtsN